LNFDLGPDELALQTAIRELCERRFPLERTRVEGVDRDGWAALEEAGVLTLRLGEDHGGLGLGMAQAVVVFEELGRALVPGPIAATHAGRTRGATEQIIGVVQRSDAVIEHLAHVDVLGVIDDEGVWRVYPREVDADPITEPLDPMTPLHRLRSLPQGERIAPASAAVGIRTDITVLHAAMLAGIAARVTEMAVDYAKQREQFGRAIGSFQAVKHLCADMLVRAEVARAAVYAAGCAVDEDEAVVRAVATAKLVAGEAALANTKAAIQVHGGMGYTWEVPVHLYLKRAAVLTASFGTAHQNEETLAAML
jgi:alkylation response protein AidB-like acyl-CoA dehydrogenase